MRRGVSRAFLVATAAWNLGAGCSSTPVKDDTGPDDPSAKYTLGGSIAGLQGTGLQLKNGSATVNVPANATTYQFAQQYAAGSAYDVSVAAQPAMPSQTCTIVNGKGAFAANVTNANLDCKTNAFPINVQLMGLEGSGLVLQNNSGDNLTVAANATTATFSQPVLSGANFSVTVMTQPTNQNCVVNGASGNVVNGPINTVVVNCSTYRTVGGTVSGLIGTGLRLAETVASVNVDVAMNGSFAFARGYLPGANYLVQVDTQPTSPAQVCTVTNGTGALPNANVTNVQVTCDCAAPTSTCNPGGAAYCADFSNDVNNCGGCGISCAASGGACVMGHCSGSTSFAFTGGAQTFTVPPHVTRIFLKGFGAQGGTGATGGNSSAGGTGGLGGSAEGFLNVTPGDVLNIFVGGQGGTPTGGFNGGGNGGSTNAGGGGGATDVRVGGTAEANRVLTAGGGGGGGRGGCEAMADAGGNGGGGGGGVGANGVDAPTPNAAPSGVAGGGKGGNFGSVQGAFGPKGVGCGGFLGQDGQTATVGTGATGGNGQSCCCFSFGSVPGGGGGGGGHLGGGGGGGGSAGTTGCSGNDKGGGGGGGGGSSFVGGVASGATAQSVQSGNGALTISW